VRLPTPTHKTIVISDIHVSAGVLDDCDSELEQQLVRFLKEIGLHGVEGGGIELVINGDFLDFAQAPPASGKDLEGTSAEGLPLGFTEQQSLRKLREIHAAHPDVFRGLSSFLSTNDDNSLTILPGNHDADFFWPKVREEFLSYLVDSTVRRTFFHLDQVYCPTHTPGVWIEHGHQYDPCNNFFDDEQPRWSESSPPIYPDKSGTPRLLQCVGTRFMVKFLNGLDERFPFVDNVKPFSRFLVLFGMSALTPGLGSFRAAVSVGSMMRFIARTVLKRPSDLLSVVESSGNVLEHPLLTYVSALSEGKQLSLQQHLQAAGLEIPMALSMYLKDEKNANECMEFLTLHPEITDEYEPPASTLSLGGGAGTLTLAKGFLDDETQLLADAAFKALRNDDVQIVVMGHTHVTEDRPKNRSYFNSGCWTRYLVFGPGEKSLSWSLLKPGAQDRFPYELNYVEIPSQDPSAARLQTFASGQD